MHLSQTVSAVRQGLEKDETLKQRFLYAAAARTLQLDVTELPGPSDSYWMVIENGKLVCRVFAERLSELHMKPSNTLSEAVAEFEAGLPSDPGVPQEGRLHPKSSFRVHGVSKDGHVYQVENGVAERLLQKPEEDPVDIKARPTVNDIMERPSKEGGEYHYRNPTANETQGQAHAKINQLLDQKPIPNTHQST